MFFIIMHYNYMWVCSEWLVGIVVGLSCNILQKRVQYLNINEKYLRFNPNPIANIHCINVINVNYLTLKNKFIFIVNLPIIQRNSFGISFKLLLNLFPYGHRIILQMDGSSNGNFTVVLLDWRYQECHGCHGISINYNDLMVHTFHRNHVSLFRFLWFLIISDQRIEMSFQTSIFC